MIIESVVLPRRYLDSVFLMRAARRMSGEPGIIAAVAVMGTGRNLEALLAAGFSGVDGLGASPDDLVVSVKAESQAQAKAVTASVDTWLRRDPAGGAASAVARTLDQAIGALPESNLVVISVPGQFAAREARQALGRGLNVFLFSDNVDVEDELELKRVASSQGLILMGPDCGTSIIAGKGIGFANAVRRGPVGIVGASGTGIQEVSCLVHNLGSGISHAIGTGSRDLSDTVGGISSLQAIDALEADAETEAIVMVSKPPGRETLIQVERRLEQCSKPVVRCILGSDPSDSTGGPNSVIVNNLEDAATEAVRLCGAAVLVDDEGSGGRVAKERARLGSGQRYLRGVFAGGTLCLQAQQVARSQGLAVYSNEPLDSKMRLHGSTDSLEHTMIDMGADEFTLGRPHPMIDSTLRAARLEQEAEDPEVAVILLDVILGLGASADPAGEMAPAIARAKDSARKRQSHLAVVASICGTDGDAQGLESQANALKEAGALVFNTGYRAALFAATLVSRRE